MVGGIGMALLEGTHLDYRDGRIVNANMSDYLVPVNADVPALDAAFLSAEDTIADPIGAQGSRRAGDRQRTSGDRQCGVQRDRQAGHRSADHAGKTAVAHFSGEQTQKYPETREIGQLCVFSAGEEWTSPRLSR